MHRHTIGKIQVLVGIVFIIFTIGFSLYAISHVIGALTNVGSSETSTWSDVKVADYNSTRAHVISSLNVDALVSLSSYYTIIFGALILTLLSIILILQGFANISSKSKQ